MLCTELCHMHADTCSIVWTHIRTVWMYLLTVVRTSAAKQTDDSLCNALCRDALRCTWQPIRGMQMLRQDCAEGMPVRSMQQTAWGALLCTMLLLLGTRLSSWSCGQGTAVCTLLTLTAGQVRARPARASGTHLPTSNGFAASFSWGGQISAMMLSVVSLASSSASNLQHHIQPAMSFAPLLLHHADYSWPYLQLIGFCLLLAALHHACQAGHTEVAAQLVIAGAPVQTADAHGRTPAHLAARRGAHEVVDKLLMAGYEVDALGGDCGTGVPLDSPQAAERAASGMGGCAVLHLAARHGHLLVRLPP